MSNFWNCGCSAVTYCVLGTRGDSFCEDAVQMPESVGVKQDCAVESANVCTPDLCYEASDQFIEELKWECSSIDTLNLVTQSSDYVLPATSCVFQRYFLLLQNYAVFDVDLGYSEYM